MMSRDRHNLVFVFADQHAAHAVGVYGNEGIETPVMDGLAGEGFLFERAYISQPVCTPSRSTLLTGLYPHSSGCTENNVPLPGEVRCFPEFEGLENYRTGYVGKWHLGDEVFAQHGFESWVSIDDNYRAHYSEDRDRTAHCTYYHFLREQGFEPDSRREDGFEHFSRGFCSRLPEEYSKAAFVGREAAQFIGKNRGEPFILFANFFEPHTPYYSCRHDQYDPGEVPLPESFDHRPGEDQPLKLRLRALHDDRPKEEWRRIRAHYWGRVSLLDSHLGTILGALRDAGLEEETIVVYTSDHGDMLGSHGLATKGVMYEEAVRVPLMIRVPGRGPERIDRPIGYADLVPTLLDLMGCRVPESLPGSSWRPYLEGDVDQESGDVFIEWNGPNGPGGGVRSLRIPDEWRGVAPEGTIKRAITDPVRTVITPGGWKLNYSLHGEHELYNLREDPHERKNLAAGGGYEERIRDLHGRILHWQRRTRDPVYTL